MTECRFEMNATCFQVCFKALVLPSVRSHVYREQCTGFAFAFPTTLQCSKLICFQFHRRKQCVQKRTKRNPAQPKNAAGHGIARDDDVLGYDNSLSMFHGQILTSRKATNSRSYLFSGNRGIQQPGLKLRADRIKSSITVPNIVQWSRLGSGTLAWFSVVK